MATSPATQEKVLSDDQVAFYQRHGYLILEERAVGELSYRTCEPLLSACATSALAWPETTAWPSFKTWRSSMTLL